jgi:hypothetical protein
MNVTLESLGISKDAIEQKLIEHLAEQLLTEISYDYDDEREYRAKSSLAKKLDAIVKQHIDATINALAEKHVLPNVASYIENLTLQTTNQWGEKKSAPVTFIEYLTQRAEDYMQEKVSYDGKAKSEASGYSWNGTQTRITFMVHQHLHHSIEAAMKQALQIATSGIASGLQETVKVKLAEVSQKLKVEVKTA